MTNLTRSLVSLSLAAGLAVSTAGIATAQSSNFFSGSSLSSTSDTGANDDFEGRHPANSLEGKFEASYAKALQKQGLKQDEELNTFAEDVADRLADGELQYEQGRYTLTWEFSEDGQYAAEITRLTLGEAAAYVPRMDSLLEDLLSGKDAENDRLGYAVSRNADHIYLVVSGPYNLAPAAEIIAANR